MISRGAWVSKMKQMLLEAGVEGLKQSRITHALVHQATAEQFIEVLDFWKEIGAVQKFRLDSKAHRPITVWRATTKLLEIDPYG
jgi:hypothetical protein